VTILVLLQVCVFNRTVEKVDEFLKNEAKDARVIGAHSLEDLVGKLKRPRRVMLMVKAGQAVDDFIDKLVGLFSFFSSSIYII
jgi:6-phosphogluconate dehydrogenase